MAVVMRVDRGKRMNKESANPLARNYPLRRTLTGMVQTTIASISVALAMSVTVPSIAQGPSSRPNDDDLKASLPDAPVAASPVSARGAAVVQPPTEGMNPEEELSVRKFPSRFLSDEVHIFTSPARIRAADLKWLLPLAGASAAAFATDTHTMRDVVSRDSGFNQANGTSSDVLRGFAIGVPVLLFGTGHIAGNEHQREAGLLAGEAMIDAYVFDEVVKYGTLRERPSQDNARGRFFVGGASSDPSFVSGHSIVAWSSAAVLAEEYHRPWQQGMIYSLATGVSLTRVLAQQHFPSDVLLGSAAGWLIGHYVYRAHHRHHGND